MNQFSNRESESDKQLEQYIQSMNPETVAQLSRPSSAAIQVIERYLGEMLGGLPSEHFEVKVTTDREQLGQLLASAMMSGYLLHNAEQRLALEQTMD